MAIIGCILLLNANVGTVDKVQNQDIGPHQIWVMSFGILFLYFNIVSVSFLGFHFMYTKSSATVPIYNLLTTLPFYVFIHFSCSNCALSDNWESWSILS